MTFVRSADPYGSAGVNLSDIALPPLPIAVRRHAAGFATPSAAHEPLASSRYAAQSAPQSARRAEILAAHFVRKSYRKASIEIPVLQGVELADRRRRVRRDRRPQRLRQEHAAAPAGHARRARRGRDLLRRPSHRQPAVGRPRHPAQPILRHGVSVLSPAAGAHDAGKRARCRR